MTQGTATYFKNFFAEKDVPFAMWDIKANDTVHIIDSECVIDTILSLSNNSQEAKSIRDILVMIDFRNESVLPFLKHLAKGLVNNY